MSRRNIYMVQATYMNGKSAYLPYAVGALTAYCKADKTINTEYCFKDIFFMREAPEKLVEAMEDPFFVGLSSYMWNIEYNKILAKKIKEKYPSCYIQFGGHQIAPGGSFLEQYDFADFLIHEEGEEPLKQLLIALLKEKPELSSVPNLSYRDADGNVITNPCRCFPIKDNPSPYLMGVFDQLVERFPDYQFLSLIETNRGCPNHCAYCSWDLSRERVRFFPMERVKAEIDWVSRHKFEFFGFSDANFGLFPRDEEIVDYMIGVKERTGYPCKFQVSYAKNSTVKIFEMTKKLHDSGMDKGITLAFQSLSPEVLENIGRANIGIDFYSELLKLYSTAGIPTYSDLILGLPGETYDTFRDGVDTLLSAGQHSSLFIHILEWFPCAQLGDPEYMKKYGIEYTVTPLNQPHRLIENKDDIPEYSRIVTKTYSMDNKMWVKMNLFSTCVQCFHHLGLLEYVAIYLHYEHNVSYGDFYDRLLAHLLSHPDTVAGKVFTKIKKHFENIISEGTSVDIYDKEYGSLTWTSEELAFLDIVFEKESFYQEIKEYLYSFGAKKEIVDELTDYENTVIKTINNAHSEKRFSYDFPSYFKAALSGNILPLEKKETKIIIDDPETYHTKADYGRNIVWYGRRGGKNIYQTEMQVYR